MEQIQNIKIEKLINHPKQVEIYGEIYVEREFTASVKDRGIITPLIVSPNGDGSYTIVSGHRRRSAAEQAGLDEVPCLVKNYENPEVMELDFLVSNMQREKTPAQRIKEFLHYKQILCQVSQVRQKQGIYAGTIFENETLSRILGKIGIKEKFGEEERLDSYEILKEITGYSEYEQTYLNILYNVDWLQDMVDEFRRDGLAESSVQEFMAYHEQMVKKYEAEEASLNEAVKKIKDTVKQIRAELEKIKAKRFGKKEQKKIPHEKATPVQKMQRKEEQKPKLAVRIEVPDEARRERISKTKYVEGYSVVEYFAEDGGAKIGVAITKDAIAGMVVNIQGVDYELNTKLLVELIKGEI
jgi:hypothetical protein